MVAAIDVPSFDRADMDGMNAIDTKIVFKNQQEILAEAMGLDLTLPDNPYIYFTPPQIELFDGRLDDNDMKDVTTEMISFASLRPCAFALNRERKDAMVQRRKERKSQFILVSSIDKQM